MEGFTKKDYVCMAEILQSAIFKEGLFNNCYRCIYSKECIDQVKTGKGEMNIDTLRTKLQNETGIYLGYLKEPKFIDSPRRLFPD